MDKMSLFPEFDNHMTADAFCVVMDELEILQHDLAARLGVDRKTVSRWAKGDVQIPGSVALLLNVAHGALRFSHRWAGPGIAADVMRGEFVSNFKANAETIRRNR